MGISTNISGFISISTDITTAISMVVSNGKYLVLLAILAVALVTDIKWRKIYNWTVVPGIVIAIAWHSYLEGFAGLYFSTTGFITGLALLLIPFALGGIGAGDVKLLATVGAFMGASFVWQAFIVIAILGGLFSLVQLALKKSMAKTLSGLCYGIYIAAATKLKVNTLGNLQETTVDNTFPYGVPIAIGTLVTMLVR